MLTQVRCSLRLRDLRSGVAWCIVANRWIASTRKDYPGRGSLVQICWFRQLQTYQSVAPPAQEIRFTRRQNAPLNTLCMMRTLSSAYVQGLDLERLEGSYAAVHLHRRAANNE
jgi:hypothetical protein